MKYGPLRQLCLDSIKFHYECGSILFLKLVRSIFRLILEWNDWSCAEYD